MLNLKSLFLGMKFSEVTVGDYSVDKESPGSICGLISTVARMTR